MTQQIIITDLSNFICPVKGKIPFILSHLILTTVNTSSEPYDRQYFYLKCCQLNKKQPPTTVTIPQRTEVPLCAIAISLLLITEHRSLSLRYSQCPAIPVAKQSRSTYQRAQRGYGNPLEQSLGKSL